MMRAGLWRAAGSWAIGAAVTIGFWAASVAARADESFDGSWLSSCLNESGKYVKRDMYVFGSRIYSTISIYGDSGCFDLLMRLEVRQAYRISGRSVLEAGADEVDLHHERSFVTAFNAPIADHWAAGMFCGILDWDVGIPRDVTGRKCGDHQVPKVGDKEYDLYLRDHSLRLWLGNRTREFDGSTPSRRPREINRSFNLRQVGLF